MEHTKVKLGDILTSISETISREQQTAIFLNTSDISEGKFLHKKSSVVQELPGQAKKKIKNGDILFSEIRPKNKRYAVVNVSNPNDYVVSTKLMVLRIKAPSKYYLQYIYQKLISQKMLHQINEIAESRSGTFPQITFDAIKNIELNLPSLEEQKRIADILTSLDDKIELNNQMNQTLEEIASLLYKRWFVDFEFPDDKGKPYKSSGGEMVDSELGMIPKGWKVKELGEISEKIITGKTPSTKDSKNFGEGTPFITIPDMYRKVFTDKTVRHITNYGRKKIQNKLIPKNSVLVSCIATPGLVSITSKESITNQQINSIVCKKQNLYFIYETLLSLKEYIILLGSGGSTTLNLNKSDFSKISICYAENRINKVFYELCDYIFNQIYENQFEIIKLENMKEELLKELL